jgi:hypothetical protein
MTKPSRTALDEALKASRLAMEIWTHQYAPEFCDPKKVAEYDKKRLAMGGTLGVITTTTALVNAAIKAGRRGGKK